MASAAPRTSTAAASPGDQLRVCCHTGRAASCHGSGLPTRLEQPHPCVHSVGETRSRPGARDAGDRKRSKSVAPLSGSRPDRYLSITWLRAMKSRSMGAGPLQSPSVGAAAGCTGGGRRLGRRYGSGGRRCTPVPGRGFVRWWRLGRLPNWPSSVPRPGVPAPEARVLAGAGRRAGAGQDARPARRISADGPRFAAASLAAAADRAGGGLRDRHVRRCTRLDGSRPMAAQPGCRRFWGSPVRITGGATAARGGRGWRWDRRDQQLVHDRVLQLGFCIRLCEGVPPPGGAIGRAPDGSSGARNSSGSMKCRSVCSGSLGCVAAGASAGTGGRGR